MRIWLAAAALIIGVSRAGAATFPDPAFPNFQSPAEVAAACDAGLAAAHRRLQALERRATDVGWLAAYDDLGAFIEDAYFPIGFLVNVHPDSGLRDAAQACELRWQDFASNLGLNETLYAAALRVKPRDRIDAEALRVTLEGFEDAGVALPPDARPRARALSERITELSVKFERNVRDDATRVAFALGELAGMPPSVWAGAPRGDDGRILLGIDSPTYTQVMESAENPAARERMWRAKTNEGGEANLAILAEIAGLRREYAALFGHDSYAAFVLRRRMAASPARTSAFLGEVKAAVARAEERDLASLTEAKARHLGRPLEKTRLEHWDLMFYTERLRRERYDVDQEAFRPYFPPHESVRFVMRIAERLFGIRYEPVQVALWHPDARAYAVVDAPTGRPLAALLVDLYPRPGKYNHAAVWSYRNGATRNARLPQAALVVNLDRKGLTLEDLETLLHEFGHALHNNLSATRYTLQAGMNTVHDFTEAPSQMLQDWVYDPRVLALFSQVCPACKPVPPRMLERARAARDHAKGILFARQHLYASYDLALHGPQAADPMALWARMEGATPLGHVAGSRYPAGFSHVAGNYGAGYYGYLWSLVVAMDLRTAFEADHLSPETGSRYRRTVLAQGAQRPPQELVREFLGRDTDSRAFFEHLKGLQ
jgi:thimet oligopeptidase